VKYKIALLFLASLLAINPLLADFKGVGKWVAPSIEERPQVFEKAQTNAKDSEDAEESLALGHIGLDDDRLRDIAENVFNLTKAMSDNYSLGDSLMLSGYIARYMAEIGEYELVSKDLMSLVKAFANLRETPVSPEAVGILKQIKKLKFGKKNGKLFVRFYSKLRDGINIEINEKVEDPKSSLKEIYYVRIEDGAEVLFEDIFEAKDKKDMIKYIQAKGKIGPLPKESVSQIHKGIIEAVPSFYDQDYPALPLKMSFDKIFVHVATRTFFKDIKFNFKVGYLLPGIRNIAGALPSFVIGMKKGIIHLKTSLDR
jgi:hypothetical protein